MNYCNLKMLGLTKGIFSIKKLGLQVKTGYFYRSISDFIDWVRDDASEPYTPINFGKNKMHGVYGRVQQDFYFGRQQSIGYELSYNYLSPSLETPDGNQSKYVLESLKHQFIAGIHYRVNDFSFATEK